MLNILLVGCGRMGEALANGWLNQGRDPARIWIVEPNQKSANKFEFVFEDPANEAQKLSFEFIGSDFAAYDGYIRSLRGLLYQK